MMGHVPAIPESTRSSVIVRLLDHAETNWPQLAKVRARYHGSFAYITGVLRNGEQIPLFRLRYGGSAHSFGFAIYSAARERYETPSCSPAHRSAPRKKPSTPPAPSTSQASDTNPRRINGATHLSLAVVCPGGSQARTARSARGQDGAGGGPAGSGPPLSAAGSGRRCRVLLRRVIGE